MPPSKENEHQVLEAIANIKDEAVKIDIIVEKRGCFRPNKDSDFYPIVQEYLNTDADVAETTTKLLAPINAAILQNNQPPNMLLLWNFIIHSAKRLLFRNTTDLNKLVNLMKAIKAHPTPPTAAQPDLFHQLSDFGMAARESINASPGGGSGYLLPEAHAYANMQYLYALLTRAQVKDFWIYCIWEMRSALETPHTDDKPSDRRQPATAVEKYDAAVLSAAVWIFALGKQIYDREEDLTPKSRMHGNPGRGGPLWQGKAEFSKQRWALWKRRFGELAGMEGLTGEVRAVAREAAGKMEEAEKEP